MHASCVHVRERKRGARKDRDREISVYISIIYPPTAAHVKIGREGLTDQRKWNTSLDLHHPR